MLARRVAGHFAHSPPKSMTGSWDDAIRAEMYDLGEYPAAVSVDATREWLPGVVVEIDKDELLALDDFEDVDSGEFKRRTTTTKEERNVWVYEYCRGLPEGSEKITDWDATPKSPKYI